MGGVYCHGGGGVGGTGYGANGFTNRDTEMTQFTLKANEIFENKGVGVNVGVDGVPNIWENKIYGGQNAGIYVAGERSRGDIVGNEVFENKDGVVLRDGACPHLERNIIRDCTRRGVVVCARGQGMLVNNDIHGSAQCNVEVRGEAPDLRSEEERNEELEKKKKAYAAMGLLVALPSDGVSIAGLLTDESGATQVTLRGNRIAGGGGGVLLCEWARGFIKQNEMSKINGCAVIISSGADPDVSQNTIHECAAAGILVKSGGKGRLENNTVRDNAGGGAIVEADAMPDFRANTFAANEGHGVLVHAGARVRFSGNTVRDTNGLGVLVEGNGSSVFRNNEICKSSGTGVEVRGSAATDVKGVLSGIVLEENDLHDNGAEGLRLVQGADPHVEKNRIHANAAEGVRVESSARSRLVRNIIEQNGSAGIFATPDAEPRLEENLVHHNEVDDEVPATLDDDRNA